MSYKPYIIIADDNKFFAGFLKGELEKNGFEVSIAIDGQAAIDAIKERKPDMLLLDLIMPKKDGFDTLSDIMGTAELSDLKVVIFSNLSQKEDIDKVLALGAKDYIVKQDLVIDHAVDKIKKILNDG